MKTVAIYSLKGGVGKTTLAVNLAWAAATMSARRTLLWDLDPQGAATFMLGAEMPRSTQAQAAFSRSVSPEKLVRSTEIRGLSVIRADRSLRGLNRYLGDVGRKRLAKLIADLAERFDRVILDCPPGLTETAEQILRAADLIVVPVIPSPLSQRALEEIYQHMDDERIDRGLVMPIFNLVDRRRTLHVAGMAEQGWPAVPMASAFEAMAAGRKPIGGLAPRSNAAEALAAVSRAIERKLASL